MIKGIFNPKKKIDPKILPSQGIFYKDDLEIYIKKAKMEDIIEYELDYNKNDLGTVIRKLKNLVQKNSSFSSDYTFNDLKSIDVVFIFLEIVKLTKGSPITVTFNNSVGELESINFDSKSFNYFKIGDDLMKSYDDKNKYFLISGYKYTLPTIGIEDSLTNYLISRHDEDMKKYNEYNYDFIYFLGEKNKLEFNEIDNLIHIFNMDIEDVEREKIVTVVGSFASIHRYSLKKGNRVIEINSKIDLERIWK